MDKQIELLLKNKPGKPFKLNCIKDFSYLGTHKFSKGNTYIAEFESHDFNPELYEDLEDKWIWVLLDDKSGGVRFKIVEEPVGELNYILDTFEYQSRELKLKRILK